MSKKNVAGTPADPVVQFAKLEIDGVTYNLAYSFNAIAQAEHVSECNLLTGLEGLSDLTALQLRGLFYASLCFERKTIDEKGKIQRVPYTIEDAAVLIRIDTIGPITAALAEAYRFSMPEKKRDPLEAGAPPAAA